MFLEDLITHTVGFEGYLRSLYFIRNILVGLPACVCFQENLRQVDQRVDFIFKMFIKRYYVLEFF